MKKLIRRWPVAVLAIGLTVLGLTVAAERRAMANMADAATRFLAVLTPEQRSQALIAFESEERLRWHFIPTGQGATSWARRGVALKAMNGEQKRPGFVSFFFGYNY